MATEGHDFWAGPVVGEEDPNVRDPAGLGAQKDLINATANALGAERDGLLKPLITGGRVVGVWCSAFPDNATKRSFLAMYCAMKIEKQGAERLLGIEEAHAAASSGRFEVHRAVGSKGYNVRFLLADGKVIVEKAASKKTTGEADQDARESAEKSHTFSSDNDMELCAVCGGRRWIVVKFGKLCPGRV